MNVYLDYVGRMEKIRKQMAEEGVDILLATREKSVCHISGVFAPGHMIGYNSGGH